MKAIVADPAGGVENLAYLDLPKPEPAPGQAVIKLAAIGVNFIDVYFRTGLYPAPESPIRLGNEGAGTIESVGEGVSFTVGQRVAYAMSRGSYAEYAVVDAANLAPLPEHVSFEQAAAVMLQGMTAHYLTHSTFALSSGNTCLIWAAAGGAGSLLVQIAKLAGATVIGAVSTEEKAELVKKLGADQTVVYKHKDPVSEVKRLTDGKGVDVVYDSVGKDTFAASLDCLKPRGMMVSFGQSSGAVGPVDPLLLSKKGSLFLTRPTLANYISDPSEFQWRTSDLFRWIENGQLALHIYKAYPLKQAADAHRDLESRRTSGKLLLIP